MKRHRTLLLVLVTCAAVASCQSEPVVALDPAVRLTGAGVRENETGRLFFGPPTLIDSARLDSLHAILRDGRWERLELPSSNYTYSVLLWRDSTVVGILDVGPEYMFVHVVTRNPVRTRRRLRLYERQMLDRWFGI